MFVSQYWFYTLRLPWVIYPVQHHCLNIAVTAGLAKLNKNKFIVSNDMNCWRVGRGLLNAQSAGLRSFGKQQRAMQQGPIVPFSLRADSVSGTERTAAERITPIYRIRHPSWVNHTMPYSESYYISQNPVSGLTNRDTINNLLGLVRVTLFRRSHYRCQNPNPKSTNQDKENTFFEVNLAWHPSKK